MDIKNILVLAPHTDDGELGLGGTISKFIEEGKNVIYVAFSTADQSVPKGYPKNILSIEVKAATQKLGIKPENLLTYHYEVRKLIMSVRNTGRLVTHKKELSFRSSIYA